MKGVTSAIASPPLAAPAGVSICLCHRAGGSVGPANPCNGIA